MEEKIGLAAGTIWQTLSDKGGQVNISDLPRLTGLSSQLAYQGLGWLAREGKVWYQTQGQKTLIGLVGVACI